MESLYLVPGFCLKERRAFLFCQQDRAILCRECDVPIHTANEHTQKHNRFLLTGTKLSAVSALYASTSPVTSGSDSASVPHSMTEPSKNSVSVSPTIPNQLAAPKNPTLSSKTTTITTAKTNEEGGLTSSISEYLIDTLPGWHVEDFLDSPSPPFGFCKVCVNESTCIFVRNFSEEVGSKIRNLPIMPLFDSSISGIENFMSVKFLLLFACRLMMACWPFWMVILRAIWVLSLRRTWGFGFLKQHLLCTLLKCLEW